MPAPAPITVNQEILRAAGLVRSLNKPMKVLGNGDLSTALFVVADAISSTARAKIEAAGGSVSLLEIPTGRLAALGLERRTRRTRRPPRRRLDRGRRTRPPTTGGSRCRRDDGGRGRGRQRLARGRLIVFESLLNAFRAPDIRRRILFVLGILLVYRLLAQVPLPGVDREQLAAFFEQNTAFGILDLFAGGGLSSLSIVGLTMNPYINASIIMQLMQGVIPSLQALSREGEYGRQRLNQYTRYLTVPMAFLQAFGILSALNADGIIVGGFGLGNAMSWVQMVTMVAGAVILMWLGELITEKGIGNGISFIIFAGIVSRAPSAAASILTGGQSLRDIVLFAVLAIVAVGVIIYIQEGQRRIPIQYASRVRGRRMYQGGQTFLPLRVNLAGVIPIIFAISILQFPAQLALYFSYSTVEGVANVATAIANFLASTTPQYALMYFLLTIGFTYFYTAFTFKPDETAEQLRKNGGFIPGIRPGRPTQDYLARVVSRITIAGALFLGHRGRRPGRRRRPRPIAGRRRARRHGPPDRRLGRRRDDEADRGAADDAQLRRLHPMTSASARTAHAGVAACAPALTHVGVRSLGCSAAPWPGLARADATGMTETSATHG